VPAADATDEFQRWATSGAADLTGPADRAGLGPPDGFTSAIDRVSERLGRASAAFGSRVQIDPFVEVTLRHRAAGLRRQGRTSSGGASRLFRSADGWIALTLPRQEDLELVPALIERMPDDDVWSELASWCSERRSADIVERACLLGLAVGELGHVPERARGADQTVQMPATPRADSIWHDGVGHGAERVRVVDLSALWAGPLCARLLALAGCDVVKVESTRRPDGARLGPPGVYAHLNAGKRTAAFDFTCGDDRRRLASLIDAAHVVIEGSRARALDQWRLGPDDITTPPVWVSITGHGRSGDATHRIGFGDDAAVSAGLVATGPDGPWFCADAVADPLTGMVAATLVSEAVANRQQVHLDVSLSGVASWFAGRTLGAIGDRSSAHPTERTDPSDRTGMAVTAVAAAPSEGPAPSDVAPLGEHTEEVLREWTS
jgi:hypothetical protein